MCTLVLPNIHFGILWMERKPLRAKDTHIVEAGTSEETQLGAVGSLGEDGFY